jgi:DNA-directed RNA polymerase delta subunit
MGKASWHKYAPLVNDKKIMDHILHLKPGTLQYEDFWEEQDYYCKNGYKPKNGSPITGKHYFYLNIWRIDVMDPNSKDQRKTLGSPWYRQMDDGYFKLFEECKQDRMGFIVIKARDKGFSEMNSVLIGSEFVMYPRANVGLAAGLEVTAQTMFSKIKTGLNNIREEYKHHFLINNTKVVTSGYRLSKENVIGFGSNIHCRTMENPNVYKGERMPIMVFEEAGEFSSLLEAYEASKPCFMSGPNQFGVPIIGGTGGDIEKASKDFKTMWYEHKDFNLRRMFIPASECYMGSKESRTTQFFNYDTGVSDRPAAAKFLENERAEKRMSGNKKAYNLHIQNYPLDVREAFLKTKDATFDIDIINFQLQELRENALIRESRTVGDIKWDDTGHKDIIARISKRKQKIQYRIDHNLPVIFTENINGHFIILHKPQKSVKHLDIGGVDSIDQDKTGTKGSEGSAIIYRNFLNINQESDLVVAEFTNRTNRALDFWEGSLLLGVYYNAEMLIEYTKINILDFYKDVNAYKYLKERPETIHSENSKALNKWGVQMTKDIKARMIEIMIEEIKEHGHKIWFEDLLQELADFGDRNTDRAMAYGLCLLHKKDNYNLKPKDTKIEDNSDVLGLVSYDIDSNGNPIQVGTY